jgi:hypothetical protein
MMTKLFIKQAAYLSGFKCTLHVLLTSANKTPTTKKVYDKIRIPGRCLILLKGSDASVLVVTSGWCDWHSARFLQIYMIQHLTTSNYLHHSSLH